MSAKLLGFIVITVLITVACAGVIYYLLRGKNAKDVTLDTDDDQEELTEEDEARLSSAEGLEEERGIVADLRSGLEKKTKVISELKDSVKNQLSALLQTIKKDPSSESLTPTEKSDPAFNDKMETLVRQTKHSNELIAQLKADFEANKQKLETLDGKLAEKAPDVTKVRKLIQRHKQLKEQNQQLARQAEEHKMVYETQQALIEELQQKVAADNQPSLSPTENSTPEVETPASEMYFDDQYAEAQLQDAQADHEGAQDEKLEQIQELERSLARTIREKDFIESHYLDLVETLPEAEEAKQELERTKKELSMLEDHVVSMDQQLTPEPQPQEGSKAVNK
ncbi:hypothetical protein [Motiliproteus sp. MSK22-1]|uniref:hypothetical protein n=1 Tax=Motiliproteus sp. MSK22-1 TaxID=1897630 RepID=UPI000975B092|nr:hypothetical protein [Motiliproteus sp. MSK22-1]OMH25588.1 hypothetical protein BGP75_23855 [Motiliproteus sp. MSK22-1]